MSRSMPSRPSREELLSTPTEPFAVEGANSASSLLERMAGTGFQGRQLGQAFATWKAMLADPECTILMGLSGAMVPGERTGVYRLGGEDVLFNAQGETMISVADFAVAIVDEAENPQATGQRVSVAPAY